MQKLASKTRTNTEHESSAIAAYGNRNEDCEQLPDVEKADIPEVSESLHQNSISIDVPVGGNASFELNEGSNVLANDSEYDISVNPSNMSLAISEDILEDQIVTKPSQSKFTKIIEDDDIDFTAIKNMILSLSEPSESERVSQEKQTYLHRHYDQRTLIALLQLLNKLKIKRDIIPEPDRFLVDGKKFFFCKNNCG